MNLFFHIILLQVSMSEAYQFSCPPQAHWNLRAKFVCTAPENYNCLYNVTLQVNEYGERCSKSRILGSGYKYVFQPNLNRASCKHTRYQPFIFDTIGSSDCTFRKSLCNSEGQTTYENGNRTSDRTCFCNTEKGYTFSRNPINPCYCNPSTEDCTCYHGINSNNKMIGAKGLKCAGDVKIIADSINTSQALQMHDFDNYKYNIAPLTNANRTIAAVFVLILVVVYTPPKNFEIVERTESSMTVEWDMNDSENCLEYKIVDSLKGSDDWEKKLFSAKDVAVKENGHCVYILHDLSPDTSYELKMCYVDKNQVKSKYTEPQTHKTLNIAPKHFDIIESTESSITVKWDIDDSEKRRAYILDHRHKTSEKWNVKELPTENIKTIEDECHVYKLQELLPETLYELRICSLDNQQVSSQYTEPKLRQTLQIAPKNFEIIESTESSITIKWDIDDTEKRRAYILDHRHKTSEKWNVKELPTENIKTIEDGCHVYKLQELLPETLYELRICSLDNQQVSSQYTEPKLRQTLQIAPKNFDIIESTESSITVKWDTDDTEKRRAYILDHRHKTSEKWNVKELPTENIKTIEDGCHVYKLQELLPETLYELRICSLDNQQVSSQYTEPKLRQTLQIAPKNFDIIESTESSITVKWDTDDTEKRRAYILDHRHKTSDKWNVKELPTENIKTIEVGCHVYKLQELLPETLYELRICSLDNQQVSSQYTEPKLRQTLQIAPKNFDIIKSTESSITIKWDIDVSDKRRAYILDHRHKTSEKWNVKELPTENIKTIEDGCHGYKLQELLPETLYELRICSLDNQQVSSQYTEPKLRQTLQIAPKNFDIIESTESSITVKWDTDDTEKRRAYILDHRHKTSDKWNVKELPTENIKTIEVGCHVYKLQELLPETLYELRICSLDNQQVSSQYTEPKLRQTLQIAPKNFDIIKSTESSITIKWDIDVSDKRRAYILDHRHKTSEKWNVKELPTENIKTIEDGCHGYKLQELLPETLYELRICSLDNQQVSSQYTEPKLRQTLQIAPKNFDIIESTESSITVKWDTDDTEKRRAYILDHRHKTSDKWNVKELPTENIKTIEVGCHVYKLQELLPETLYELRICSLDNQQVSSQYTEPKLRQTLQIAPKNFDIIKSTESSITIKWDIDVSDKRRAYILDHRHKTSEKWNVKELPTENIKTIEDGCHGYKLQELLPETLYELRICSLDNQQVSSQYTEPKLRQTLQIAPKNFDIIESTENSLTIKWDIDDTDKRLVYILDHRHKTSDKWNVKELPTENIETNEDGCHVYKLQELSPDTLYELRICSLDNQQVSSQYTEPKLRQTLHIALPKAINQLQEKDRIRYINIVQGRETEKRYFVRIMIVGKGGVGKSCLLKRLLNESIDGVTSTDGVDIVVRRCKINIDDGTWTIDKVILDDTADRIKMAIMKDQNKGMENDVSEEEVFAVSETYHQQLNAYNANPTINESITDVPLGNHNETFNSSMTSPSEGELRTSNVDIMDASSTNLNDNDNEDYDSEYNASDHETVTNTATRCILTENEDSNNSKHLVMPSDLMSEVFTKTSTSDSPSMHYALCGLWDFAGQKEFYGTHQAFLTSSAIYLVVADMDTEICKEMTELDGTENKEDHKQESMNSFKDLQAGEYMDFWFESIHCYRSTNLAVDNSPIDPPVIVVFTGKDKYEKKNLTDMKERQSQLDDELTQLVAKHKKYRHYRHKFYLSNTEDPNEVFLDIQDKISEIARKMSNWGEPVPLKWILLETLIDINKNSGKSFITLDEMIKIAKHPQIEIHDYQEVLLFLRFQHEVGKIVFFDDISNLIILDPQWLANAFRCLVSDRINIIDKVEDKDKVQIASDMTELTNKGKISDLLIKTLFRLKGGNQFLNQMEDLLKVMKKFDILVEFEGEHSYIMPSMMPSTSFQIVCQNIGILQDTCQRSSWFCLKFDFLPPNFFSHVSVWLMKKYEPSKFKLDKKSFAFALYRGFCVFDFDEGACDKLLMTMSTDTIALQVVSFHQYKDLRVFCANIRKELIQKVKDIQKRYKIEVSYDEMLKCSDYSDAKSFAFMERKEEFYCVSCKKPHRSKTIYLPWIPEFPEIETTPDVTFTLDLDPDYCIGEGETLQLKCSFVPDNVDVKWLKNREVIQPTEHIVIDQAENLHTLTIKYAYASDSGQYCIAVGNVQKITDVTVQEMFTSVFDPAYYIIEGESLQLICSVFPDDVHVKWFKDDVEVKPYGNVSIDLGKRHYNFTIKWCTINDTGQYSAVAKNVRKQTIVLVKALFKRPLEKKTTTEGANVIFECEVEKPHPAVWYKDDIEVTPSSRIKIVTKDRTVCQLMIMQTTPADIGKYEIRMNNVHSFARLEVNGPFWSYSSLAVSVATMYLSLAFRYSTLSVLDEVRFKVNVEITDLLFQNKIRNADSNSLNDLADGFRRVIQDLYTTVPGSQEVFVQLHNSRPGLTTVDLTSQGFYDEALLRQTIEDPIRNGKIGTYIVSSYDFAFKAVYGAMVPD